MIGPRSGRGERSQGRAVRSDYCVIETRVAPDISLAERRVADPAIGREGVPVLAIHRDEDSFGGRPSGTAGGRVPAGAVSGQRGVRQRERTTAGERKDDPSALSAQR